MSNSVFDFAANWYHEKLQKSQVDFFKSRGLNDETIHEWRLGYAPNHDDIKRGPAAETDLIAAGLITETGRPRFYNRGMFPIFNDSGDIVSFGGRYLGSQKDVPKYLNGPDTPFYHKEEILYGMSKHEGFDREDKYTGKQDALMVEGYFDVLSVWQEGFKRVFGSCGTAATRKQMSYLKELTSSISIMYDGDIAGRRASAKGAESAIAEGLFPHIISLGENVDPDDLIRQGGIELVMFQMERGKRSFAEHLRTSIDKTDIGQRCKAVNYAIKVIAKCPDPAVRLMLIDDLSYAFEVDRNLINTQIEKCRIYESPI